MAYKHASEHSTERGGRYNTKDDNALPIANYTKQKGPANNTTGLHWRVSFEVRGSNNK